MPDASDSFVFDTVSLSNFALCDGLWLLRERYAAGLSTTGEVLAELEAGVAAGHDVLAQVVAMVDDGEIAIVTMGTDERRLYRGLLSALGAGEASCLAVATSCGAVVVTDDAHARNRAQELGARVTGTVGILKAACQDGDISLGQAEEMLERMIGAGYYSPVRRLADIMV